MWSTDTGLVSVRLVLSDIWTECFLRVLPTMAALVGEVGGRWSEETRRFISLLAKAKVKSEPANHEDKDDAILSCADARAYAASLLELKHAGGADGDVPPTHEVVNEFRQAG